MIALAASSARARLASVENPRLVDRRFLLIVQVGRKLVAVDRLDLTLGDPVGESCCGSLPLCYRPPRREASRTPCCRSSSAPGVTGAILVVLGDHIVAQPPVRSFNGSEQLNIFGKTA